MKLGGHRRADAFAVHKLSARLDGFTIAETLIVLAVTGMLFLAAVMLINGRQNRTQFMTAINGLQQQLQQVINETANGFYPRDSAFSCTKGSTMPPTLGVKTSGDYQGQNADCIFMGKVIQFAVKNTDPQTYQILPIIGNRTIPGNGDVEASTLYGSTTGAFPEAAATGISSNPTITGSDTSAFLANGLTVVSMWYGTSTANTTGAVGFISSLPTPDGGGVASGTQTLGLYRVVGSALQETPQAMADHIYPVSSGTPLMPVTSVSICVASGTTDQSGLIVIGANDGSAATGLAVSLAIKTGTAC